jgi:hypothetical protein
MNSQKRLYELPVASTRFHGDPVLCDGALSYKYYEDKTLMFGGISFKRVTATRTRTERCCTVWHTEAYDKLVEVHESSWLKEIEADTDPNWRYKATMHHYMMYLDSAGCFELIAESWELLPTKIGIR